MPYVYCLFPYVLFYILELRVMFLKLLATSRPCTFALFRHFIIREYSLFALQLSLDHFNCRLAPRINRYSDEGVVSVDVHTLAQAGLRSRLANLFKSTLRLVRYITD